MLLANTHSGCYPFQDKDQFVIEECPHVYFVGNQPRYDTTVIDGPAGQHVRLVTIPKFHTTGELVLLDVETLEVEIVKFDVHEET
jgi:DNA polymerase delta subunit 2